MLKINNLKMPLDYTEYGLKSLIGKKINVSFNDILNVEIVKKAIDARDKQSVFFVLNVQFELAVGVNYKHIPDVEEVVMKEAFLIPHVQTDKVCYIIGTGPAGLFAGLVLAQAGLKPILIERGKMVDDRVFDVNLLLEKGVFNSKSNIIFGEGGAGTFSDGKLTTNIKSDKIGYILKEFVSLGANEDIMYMAKPHIGTDVLVGVLRNMRKKIISLGGKFLFETMLEDIVVENGMLKGIVLKGENSQVLDADYVILAIGHSARDTYRMLYNRGVNLVQKPFSMGVRIEHLQEKINQSQYGSCYNNPHLGSADYKLACHLPNGRSVYTFCMCPGGFVVPAMSQEHMVNVNGMSNHARNEKNANSAVLVNVETSDFANDHPLAGIDLQEKYEHLAYQLTNSYCAPAMYVGDFLGKKIDNKINPSYRPGVVFTDIRACLPEFVSEAIALALPIFDRKIKGFADSGSVLTAIEARSSSPVRIVRDDNFLTNIKGLYPIGEGAGYAGGITSSAVDGINVALKILEGID